LLNLFLGVESAATVAICDPFGQRREAAGQAVKNIQGHDPKLYNDFREMLADKSIDAVVVATPDHWHIPIGLAVVRAGKHIYLEKPLGHSLDQNHAMLEACRKHNPVFQYGTQQRGQEIIKRGVELVLNGYIGDLQRIDIWAPGCGGGGSLEEIPVPEGLDYEMYIGPAPMKPCTKDRITNLGSYYCSDYSLGQIANWGAHPIDVALWGTDSDTKGKIAFQGTGTFPTPDALFNTCGTWDINIQFADGVTAHFMSHDKAEPIVRGYRKNWDPQVNGTTFIGSKGWVSLSRNSYEASTPEWFGIKQCDGTKRALFRGNFYKSFVDAVRDGVPSVAPIENAIRGDTISHLSLMAIQSGGEVVWDPKEYRIVSPTALNSQMGCPIRGQWAQS
jgi:predicted dehydrogenase